MVKDVSIVVPVYNEEKGISAVVTEISHKIKELALNAEIIIVNDGSTDNTASLLNKLVKEHQNLRVLTHKGNRGYGAALKTGILQANQETIAVIDADCTYPLDHFQDLLAGMDEADMVVGARTGDTVEVETLRRPAKWFLRKLAGYLAERDIPDVNSGFRVFNREIALSYFHILPNKFSFTTTITLAMFADDYTVAYVPINYYGRKGDSKIRPFDAWNFLVLILKTIFYFNPLKIVLPLALITGLAGLSKLGYDVLVLDNLTDTTVLLILFSIQILGFGLLADLIVRRT